jgi:hypothetical protein
MIGMVTVKIGVQIFDFGMAEQIPYITGRRAAIRVLNRDVEHV